MITQFQIEKDEKYNWTEINGMKNNYTQGCIITGIHPIPVY